MRRRFHVLFLFFVVGSLAAEDQPVELNPDEILPVIIAEQKRQREVLGNLHVSYEKSARFLRANGEDSLRLLQTECHFGDELYIERHAVWTGPDFPPNADLDTRIRFFYSPADRRMLRYELEQPILYVFEISTNPDEVGYGHSEKQLEIADPRLFKYTGYGFGQSEYIEEAWSAARERDDYEIEVHRAAQSNETAGSSAEYRILQRMHDKRRDLWITMRELTVSLARGALFTKVMTYDPLGRVRVVVEIEPERHNSGVWYPGYWTETHYAPTEDGLVVGVEKTCKVTAFEPGVAREKIDAVRNALGAPEGSVVAYEDRFGAVSQRLVQGGRVVSAKLLERE